MRQGFRTCLNIIEIQAIDESLHIDVVDQTDAKSTPNRAMTRTDQQPGRRHSYRGRLPESITVKTTRTEAFNRNSNLSINHSISELVKGFLREYRDLSQASQKPPRERGLSDSVDLNRLLIPDQPMAGACRATGVDSTAARSRGKL